MMRLTPPIVPEPASHQQVLEQRGPGLKHPDIIAALTQRFQQYKQVAPEFQTLSVRDPVLAPHLVALQGLYKSTTAAAIAIRKAVDDVRPKRCPYCGVPKSPKTRDHFLAQSENQEYSLFALNLIHCCPDCNRKKKVKVWDSTGQRWYLNPYYDTFLDKPFVHLLITPDRLESYLVPKLDYRFNWEGCTAQQVETCELHFEKLDVKQALTDYYIGKLRSFHRSTWRRAKRGPLSAESLKIELVDDADIDSAEHGINCWESIFSRALAQNGELLHFLISVNPEPKKPLREGPPMAA